MTASQTWHLMAVTETPAAPWLLDMDMWPYRDRTVALLKRYARSSVELGRLPSLLGREFFRSRITSYSLMSFEDIVIFVHDVESALEKLSPFHAGLVAMNVLEEYSKPEVSRLLRCPLRTVEREIPEALDELSRTFLRGGMMRLLPTCQEDKKYNFEVSGCNHGKKYLLKSWRDCPLQFDILKLRVEKKFRGATENGRAFFIGRQLSGKSFTAEDTEVAGEIFFGRTGEENFWNGDGGKGSRGPSTCRRCRSGGAQDDRTSG